ncbi:GNAT family N-acetyltransferase [Streptodolium elevatio]
MNRITPEDVGRRVSVRRRLNPEGAPDEFGDVVGELVAWDGGVLTITRKDGSIARVAERTVTAAKVVPPVPVRGPAALSPEVLAAASDRAWPAVEYAELGRWRLRAASGFTRRANSVLALGGPGVPAAEAVARVRAWYAERGLPVYFQTVVGSDTDLLLAAEGWPAEAPTIVRTARLAAVRDRATPAAAGRSAAGPSAAGDVAVHVSDVPDAAWMARYNRAAASGPAAEAAWAVVAGTAGGESAAGPTSGGPGTGTVRHAFAAVHAADLGPGPETDPGPETHPGPRAADASRISDVPIAIGRVSVDLGGTRGPGGAGLRVASFTAIETDPAYRRRGLARAVMAALTDHALRAGATTGLLGVEAGNGPALRLYEDLGFTEHHRYHYRREP